ncbi:MAG TPA: DUF3016 domain-containing protein, partial [Rubrivivax sp.]|nr:DUF3016 domain-containing protein [Rubrivivax sp.]
MNSNRTLLLTAALCCAALPVQAAGKADVSYVKPEAFRDAGRGSVEREKTMASLTRYVQQLARQLPDGQTLRLEVTDIDLAGEIHPSMRLNDLRVLRGGADWPSLNLRYTLLDGSRTLKSGEAQLADMAYMFS